MAQRVVVVGGGVIGTCCAYYLARRGVDVLLLERGEIAGGASSGNAGVIAPGHPPINKPERRKRPLKLLLDPVSPLYIAARWDPELVRWLWAFRRKCTEQDLLAGMEALAPLGQETPRLFEELAHDGVECGYRQSGYHEVCRTEAGLRAAVKDAELMRRYGYRVDQLDPAGFLEREPSFRPDTVGSVFYADGGICRPGDFVRGVARRVEELGGAVQTGVAVTGVEAHGRRVRGVRTEDGRLLEADAVVLATGAYSPTLMRDLGCPLPVQPAKGYHRELRVGPESAPPLGTACVLAETLVFCTPMNGSVRFAGTLEFSGINHEVRRRRIDQLTRAAGQYLADFREATPVSEWCGLRPCTSDGLPVVGPVPGVEGAFVATGHAMMGLTLGPITGELVAGYVVDGSPSMDVEALNPDRFLA
jgi:D-amino-acid dehydrogenase